jgi:S-adenosylmethionine:tRNA ribosyltransferase-isomerase
MDINLFDYYLPEALIAQHPEDKRDHSRLLAVNKSTNTFEDKHFYDIIDYLRPGDVLVRNNTKVIPARLYGMKDVTGAKVEVLLLKEHGKNVWECLVGNAKAVRVGTKIHFSDELSAVCLEKHEEGIHVLEFFYEGIFIEILEKIGHAPLPPYIKDDAEQYSRYQTVYAKIEGSAAAPTAGFHFTEELLERIKVKGVEIVDVTLHVGLGTFRPVSVSDTKDHKMHFEYYEIKEEAAATLNKAKDEGRRIIAVGTTSTRTLEANIGKHGKFVAENDKTNLFITPGYTFKGIDALITNFHLPKSTLIMLVSALANRELIIKAYEHAVKAQYRFFSFGDAMFIYG